MLRGNATATVDDKGRFKLPVQYREYIEETWGSDFYVTSFEGESVQIYPLPVWQEIEEKLAKLPSQHPTKKKYLDRTSYYGYSTSLDKSGRILIPALLRESAKMTGEVAVLGALTYLDVWNHDLIKARLENQTVTNEDKEILSQLGI
jgi:transcriptional regulator MraZ